jgi:methylmalonyl-CoA/ethylmalonyl-CoA epimerase
MFQHPSTPSFGPYPWLLFHHIPTGIESLKRDQKRGMSDVESSENPLHQVALAIHDVRRSMEFYGEKLGAELIAEFDPPGLLFFRLGEVLLLLERSEEPQPGGAVLYLAVPDIRSAFETLRARGIEFGSEPHLIHRDDQGLFGEPGGEEWMAFFRDPDDNHLAIASRISPT